MTDTFFQVSTTLAQGVLLLVDGILRGVHFAGSALDSGCKALGGRRRDSAADKRKKVVIVGASFAGLWSQRNLCNDFDVTVVDFKEYFEYTPGVLRAFVEPGHFKRISGAIPRRRNKFLCGEAIGLTADRRSLRVLSTTNQQETEVPFDYLLIGTGSTYAGAVKAGRKEREMKSRSLTWKAEAERLAAARSVLIIGGGPVGVELAGEILSKFPGKEVTITDRSKELCSSFRPSTKRYVTEWLRKRGCRLALGVPIDGKYPDLMIDEKGCRLTTGERLQADKVYRCMGLMPATKWLKGSLPDAAFDNQGFLRVNHHLQVEGFKNVFAMGDCMIHKPSSELKLGHTAEVNAHLVVENLRRLESKQSKALLTYPTGVVHARRTPLIYCISLGKHSASLGFNWLVVNGLLAAIFKWMLEYTKVLACSESPVGIAFWKLADFMSLLIARTLIKTPDA